MKEITIGTYDVIVIGTGAAGYNAACRIKEIGTKSVCIVTEGKNCGTSRNTGSDKQTYYKLGLGGSAPDSVRNMAANLFAGGCVDGDNALCEAALSARCFYNLCEAGVPFPCNRYGEFVGYKTDHDPYARATSAGPLTSKFMTEVLEKKANALGVEVYDHMLAIELLTDQNGVCGLLCLDRTENRFVAFSCANIILATGGPAGIYADSVYPTSHRGSTGLALRAGASLQNMTEWQYGLASVAPRWNVSGTYMQVLPRFVSIDEDGEEREFLTEFFADKYEALSKVFLKGYQWPFDAKKAYDGSSIIDLLVYKETVLRKRRVYLDFTKNPFGLEQLDYERLSAEAFGYLDAAKACFGTPIERLQKMNTPAIELYAMKGVDLQTEYLEIALCAQHNNGGIAVDAWWQTEVMGLFAAGECAGTHGITRPGGSALNAGQVGSLRAAQFISASDRAVDFGRIMPEESNSEQKEITEIIKAAMDRHEKLLARALKNDANVDEALKKARKRMSDCGGAIRDIRKMREAYAEVHNELTQFSSLFGVKSKLKLVKLYRLRDTLTVQLATLGAMIDYAENVKLSRGSALYYDEAGELQDGLDEMFRFSTKNVEETGGRIQQVAFRDGELTIGWRSVRPMPEDNDVFETVWREYRKNKNVY